MATTIIQPRDVTTEINYFHDTGQEMVPMVIGGPTLPKPQPKIPTKVVIADITGQENQYTLDKQGFQYVQHQTCLQNFDDDDEIRKLHYPEMEELIRGVLQETKDMPSPSSVHILTHIIRRSREEGDPVTPVGRPLYGVHVDQSFAAAKGVAERFLGDRAEELLKKPRYQIVNTWRPLFPVTKDPFAVSDARSIPDSDLIFVPVVFPTHNTEAIEVRPSADHSHKWYYKQNQKPDEVLFFMQVDSSEKPGVARRVPHCAFNDTSLPEGTAGSRASIEVRALVFYDSED